MSNLSDIKRRLTTAKKTRQITGAMQTVSVAKMRKAAEVCDNSKAYVQLITDVMRSAASDNRLVAPDKGKDVLLVLSSDRGLCGGFDNAIFSAAQEFNGDNTVIMPVGHTAVSHYKKAKNADLRFSSVGTQNAAHAKQISDYLIGEYGNGVKSISVAYSEIVKQSVCPKVERLLPPEADNDAKVGPELLLEPSPQQVLNALLPLYLLGKLHYAFTANYAAEQSARQLAMSTATKSADELIMQLSFEYNRERQSSVTGQIVEIAGATAALNGKGVVSEKRF